MSGEFLAQSLSSNQLLALLFVCESARKGLPAETADAKPRLEEMLSTFAGRLTHLAEPLRLEVVEAHLMSVEDVDVYNNDALEALLSANSAAVGALANEIGNDPRFALPGI